MKFLQNSLRIIISLGSFLLLLYVLRDKIRPALDLLSHDVSWKWFGLSTFFYVGALSLFTFRILQVFKVQHVRMTFFEAFYLNFIGLFFNLFLPSAVGGDVVKAYYAYKYSGKKLASTTVVILDRILGFVALITMAMFAVLYCSKEINDPRINKLIYTVVGVMIFSSVFFLNKRFAMLFSALGRLIPSGKWRQRLEDLYHAIHEYRNHRWVLLNSIFLSFGGQVLINLCYFGIARSMGVSMDLWVFFLIVPIVNIISMVPSIGGLGVREASVIYLYGQFMPAERAIAISLLLNAIIYGCSLLGGILFAFRGGLKAQEIGEIESLK